MIVIFHNGQENGNAYLTLWRWEISCSQIDNDIFGNCSRYNDDYGNDVYCFEEDYGSDAEETKIRNNF